MLTKKVFFKVDGKTLQTLHGNSVLQACFTAYIDIPRFCYHEGLRIAGNCRMCLVEVVNNRKLIASCATPLVAAFSVFTKTFRVKRARQAVLEFLLINHPLDCPICDQGGECDLQDITLVYGSDRGRFYEVSKRAIFDKNLGPLIKTSMNRCIHCTRCIRFFQETSFLAHDKLGLLGRGSFTEVGTYIPKFMLGELSGNVIDLCPVGALTSKPFAFKARTWELQSYFTYDIIDCFMPRVRFDMSGQNILRVLPYMGVYKSGWINNRTRFCYDAMNMQREHSCMWNITAKLEVFILSLTKRSFNFNYIYIPITWKDAFNLLFISLLQSTSASISSFVSSLSALEDIWAIKQFFLSIGSLSFFFEDFSRSSLVYDEQSKDFRALFSFDWDLELLDLNLWFVFLIGLNLRMESPLLFLQLKKLSEKGFLQLLAFNSTFLFESNESTQTNISMHHLFKFFEFRSNSIRPLIKKALFFKFFVFINLELSCTPIFNCISYITDIFFNILFSRAFDKNSLSYFCGSTNIGFLRNYWRISIIQRYVGHISYSEVSLASPLNKAPVLQLFTNNSLNFFFNINSIFFSEKAGFSRSPCTNILFNSVKVFPLINITSFFLILPVVRAYEEDFSFYDIFLNFKKILSISSINSNRKSISHILTAFSVFLKFFIKKSWLAALFMYLQISFTNLDDLYTITAGYSFNGCSDQTVNTVPNKSFLCKKDLFFIRTLIYNFTQIKTNYIYFFFFNNLLFNIPLLNFYEDSRLAFINYSKTMRQSSIAFVEMEQKFHFSIRV